MTPKRKIYLTGLVFGAVFVALFIIGVFPQIKKLETSSQELVLQKKAVGSFQGLLESSKDFQENYSRYQSILEGIDKGFVNPEVPLGFIEFLEAEAQKSNIEIKISPLPSPPTEADPWESIGFRIFIGGSFPNCLRFLEKLEQGPYLAEIFQLNIERVKEKEWRKAFENLQSADVSFDVLVKTFSGKALEEGEE